MARVPAADRPAVSQWLIKARGQTSARKLLDGMRAATGWAPNLANYAQWESGVVTPKEANLARVIGYHASRGVARPDFAPQAPAVDPTIAAMDRQSAALAALVAELRVWRTADQRRIEALERNLSPESMAVRIVEALAAAGIVLEREPSDTAQPIMPLPSSRPGQQSAAPTRSPRP